MNTLHPIFAAALRPFAPPLSALHSTEAQRLAGDMAMHADKLAGTDHHYRKALDMQIQRATYTEAFTNQQEQS